ncbi:MAG TPA: DUF1232 domain-containing protein, partial [Noviherbaspirillum sp.]|nr:DUF1232 domain-containing protein [Noviherbaspirillum sp.]
MKLKNAGHFFAARLPKCLVAHDVRQVKTFFREQAMLLRLGRLLRMTGRDIVVLWYACRSPAAPRTLKLAAVLIALYVLSPIDLVPDWLPLLGWADDVTLLALALPALLALFPPDALIDARAAAARWTWRTPW